MQRGKFFGYRKADPCPACGQDRILLYYDDTAVVVPVVWEDVDTCDGAIVVTAPAYAGDYWERRSAKGRSCPKCGGPVQKHEEYIQHGLMHVCVFRCTKPLISPQFRRVQGCPQCSNVTTWHGAGLTAGD